MLSTAGNIARLLAISIVKFRAFDVKTGKILWETRLGTSVQGFPVSFTVGGKYIAVTTGLGGSSARVRCRSAIIPEVHHPNTTTPSTCQNCRSPIVASAITSGRHCCVMDGGSGSPDRGRGGPLKGDAACESLAVRWWLFSMGHGGGAGESRDSAAGATR